MICKNSIHEDGQFFFRCVVYKRFLKFAFSKTVIPGSSRAVNGP
jgi:hypothetical protein